MKHRLVSGYFNMLIKTLLKLVLFVNLYETASSAALAVSAVSEEMDISFKGLSDNPRSHALTDAMILKSDLSITDHDRYKGFDTSYKGFSACNPDIFKASWDIDSLIKEKSTLYTAKLFDVAALDFKLSSAIQTQNFSFKLPEPLLQPLPEITSDKLIMPFNLGGAAIGTLITDLLVVKPKETCLTETVSRRRISKHSDTEIKTIREAKKKGKQRDRDRKKARNRKSASLTLWD